MNEGNQNQSSDDIEDGVGVCDLFGNVARSEALNEFHEWEADSDDGEGDGTDDVEHHNSQQGKRDPPQGSAYGFCDLGL